MGQLSLWDIKIIKMRLAIIGHGKMGKTIEQAARKIGHEVSLIIDLHNQHITKDLTPYKNNIDVAIEFSIPGIAHENITNCLKAGIPVVSGTTGWLDKFDEVIELTKRTKGTFFYSSNYSIGVNLFFEINKYATRLFNAYPDYNLSIEEIHHLHKLDSPSGTAITLANNILAISKIKDHWTINDSNEPKDLKITSIRQKDVAGIHTTKIENQHDIIEIKHIAKSRIGFADGALEAAKFIQNKVGVFGMSDLLNFQ